MQVLEAGSGGPFLRDIGMDRDEVGDATAGVAHGLDVDLLPVGSAVLGVIEDFDVARRAGRLGLPQPCDRRRSRIRTLEDVAGLAIFEFLERVASHALEGGVDPFDATSGAGNDHAIGRVLRHEGEAGIGLGDGLEVGVGFAQFASAQADGFLQLGGLLLQARGQEHARLV